MLRALGTLAATRLRRVVLVCVLTTRRSCYTLREIVVILFLLGIMVNVKRTVIIEWTWVASRDLLAVGSEIKMVTTHRCAILFSAILSRSCTSVRKVESKDAFVIIKGSQKADGKTNYNCMLFDLVTLGLRSL